MNKPLKTKSIIALLLLLAAVFVIAFPVYAYASDAEITYEAASAEAVSETNGADGGGGTLFLFVLLCIGAIGIIVLGFVIYFKL